MSTFSFDQVTTPRMPVSGTDLRRASSLPVALLPEAGSAATGWRADCPPTRTHAAPRWSSHKKHGAAPRLAGESGGTR